MKVSNPKNQPKANTEMNQLQKAIIVWYGRTLREHIINRRRWRGILNQQKMPILWTSGR